MAETTITINAEKNIKNIRKEFQKHGVFYSSTALAETLKRFLPEDVKEVYDPTCGAGSLLSVFGDDVRKYGQELDPGQAQIAQEQLTNAEIVVGDTLKTPAFSGRKFEAIVANPPFSLKWEPMPEDERFKVAPAMAPKSKADFAFILHCLHYLSDTGVCDRISKVYFHDIYAGDKIIAWMWYGACNFKTAIPREENPMLGFRLRQGNIQIGNNSVVAHLFKESRGNSYFVGEIFAVDKNLIPNSQRDYFNENNERNILENELKSFFYQKLHKLYHRANKVKNLFKKIDDYNDIYNKIQIKHAKGFIDTDEEKKLESELAEAEKARNDAQKNIDRIFSSNPPNSEESAEVWVINKLKEEFEQKKISESSSTQAHETTSKTVKPTISQRSTENKLKYFTDNLLKLDKKQRKLLSQVLKIVNSLVSEEVAEKIKDAITEEFK